MRPLAFGAALVLSLLGVGAVGQMGQERQDERAFRRAVGAELDRLHAENGRLRSAVARGVPEPLGKLIAVVECESNWRPGVVSPSGSYRGLGQFARSTWRSVGGTGDPARASVAEQLGRMLLLVDREGWAPWPWCGRL